MPTGIIWPCSLRMQRRIAASGLATCFTGRVFWICHFWLAALRSVPCTVKRTPVPTATSGLTHVPVLPGIVEPGGI